MRNWYFCWNNINLVNAISSNPLDTIHFLQENGFIMDPVLCETCHTEMPIIYDAFRIDSCLFQCKVCSKKKSIQEIFVYDKKQQPITVWFCLVFNYFCKGYNATRTFLNLRTNGKKSNSRCIFRNQGFYIEFNKTPHRSTEVLSRSRGR